MLEPALCLSIRPVSTRWSCLASLTSAAALSLLLAAPALGQANAAPANPAPPAAAGVAATAPAAVPAPQDVTITTRDGVELQVTFFPGTKGKDTVPVILLHMYKGSRADYTDLGLFLQSLGHAVLVPDLRGHGGSTHVKGVTKTLDASSLTPYQFYMMVESDLESLKGFLMARNNAGELNIDKLCVVGAEMGAVVALNWAKKDWDAPTLLTGKQGQDVKALVLISPEFSFHGMTAKAPMADVHIRRDLSILILVGNGKAKSAQEAERLNTFFKPSHPMPPADKRAEDQDLFFVGLNTTLQGTKVLGVKELGVEKTIAQFIMLRLEKKNFPWVQRK